MKKIPTLDDALAMMVAKSAPISNSAFHSFEDALALVVAKELDMTMDSPLLSVRRFRVTNLSGSRQYLLAKLDASRYLNICVDLYDCPVDEVPIAQFPFVSIIDLDGNCLLRMEMENRRYRRFIEIFLWGASYNLAIGAMRRLILRDAVDSHLFETDHPDSTQADEQAFLRLERGIAAIHKYQA